MPKEITNNQLFDYLKKTQEENKTEFKKLHKDNEDLAIMVQSQFEEQDKKFSKKFDEQDKKFSKKFDEQDKKFSKRFNEQDIKLENIELKLTNVAYRFELEELKEAHNVLLRKFLTLEKKVSNLATV